jgi:ribonuclease HII
MNAVSLDFERALPPGSTVMGIDEAGRGPLAGPVFAAAVSVPLDAAADLLTGSWAAINDSKKLSEKRRDALAEVIKATPSCTWAVASASALEIDQLNILRATHLAMRRAALALAEKLTPHEPRDTSFAILVDGLAVPSLPFPSQNVVKGDAKSLFIAAASILAKTARDADCLRLEAQYPGYGFARHKGYPTAAHLDALARLGPCPEHRRSFGPVSQMRLFP